MVITEKETEQTKLQLFFIELIAYWEGGVNATTLCDKFGLHRNTASPRIKEYASLAEGNFSYCSSLKNYRFLSSPNLLFISGDVSQYLNWLQTGNITEHPIHQNLSVSNLSLKLPARQVAPELIRALVQAIREQKRIEVDYVSLSAPDHQGRIITPHSFVNTGLRWHLRAYCEKSREYRDFVLSRFRGNPDFQGESTHSAEQDIAWNTQVTLIVQPNPQLTQDQKIVVANDYQMQNGQLLFSTKACLAQYWLQEMQINLHSEHQSPESQPLVLVNKNELSRWLFDCQPVTQMDRCNPEADFQN